MTAKIVITGISEAEQAARDILAHIEQIKEIQRNTLWSSSGIRVELTEKEEAASGN